MSTLCHMALSPSEKQLLNLARARGMLSARESAAHGIHTQTLSRLVRDGHLERIARGQYRLPGQPFTEHHALAVVAAAVPRGVICLLSALSFHGLGTQLPPEVWIAVDRRARRPAFANPPLRVVRFTGPALTSGIEVHKIEK